MRVHNPQRTLRGCIYTTPRGSHPCIVFVCFSIVVVRLSKNKRQQRLQYVSLPRLHKQCMRLVGEDGAKLHILSETTKKGRFILHHPYAPLHSLPAPLNRHRRRRFTDVVEVGRPTSTMSVWRGHLSPCMNSRKRGLFYTNTSPVPKAPSA